MEISGEYSDAIQDFNINMEHQTASDNYNEDYFQNWNQLIGDTLSLDNPYQQDTSQSDSNTDQTASFGFQQQENTYQYNQNLPPEEINTELDYETIIRSKHLYFDPDPQVIRKPTMASPLIYNQNIMVRFLQPPPIDQGPLIIREVRPPQPPPPPPLVSSDLDLFNTKFQNRLFVNVLHLHFHHHRLSFENDLHQYLLL
jgi:hypothetical protein